MEFQTTPGRVVNRFWYSLVADSNGIIATDNEELIELLKDGYKFPVFWAKPAIVETENVIENVETIAKAEPQKRGRKAK